jgi:zinc transport system substrate-binding protein
MSKNLKIISFLIATVILFTFNGCSRKSSQSDDKITIAVSIVPEETFVRAVAGDKVEIVTMIPPGKSPESYSPTPQEMESFSRADLYFSIGVPAEQASILPKVKDFNSKIKIVDLAARVEEVYPHRYFDEDEEHSAHDGEDNHRHEGRDPHIWLSPKRVMVMIDVIAREMSNFDPVNKSFYEKNAHDYIEKLEELDSEIRTSLSNIKNKTFIVYHPAFGYFADDYNLNMIAIENEGKEATAKDLQHVIDVAKSQEIKVVFYQAETDSKQARTLAEEIDGKTKMLEPLSADYINNLRKMANAFLESTE